jgi:phage/plasmid-like protein (TIGR03299 family)
VKVNFNQPGQRPKGKNRMPANFESGFTVGEWSWHREEINLKEAPDTETGIKVSGLDWDVYLKKICLYNDPITTNTALVNQNTATSTPFTDYFATVRSTDNSVLGVVGKRYRPLQNRDAFKIFDPFLATQQATLETAGSLDHGRKIWVLAKLNLDPMQITPKDVVNKYILLSHSHDGSLAIRLGFNPVRVVCSNTLAMAHGAKDARMVRVKHTANAVVNLEAVRETMNLWNQQFDATAEQYRFLASRDGINQTDVRNYIKLVLNLSEEGKKHTTRMNTLIQNVIHRVETAPGQIGVQMSPWKLYNGVNYYLAHDTGRTEDGRLNSLWFGPGQTKNQNALDLALKLAKGEALAV